MSLPELKAHLKQIYKISDFRFQQEDIISEILNKRAVAAFLPTGAGKTLLYQFPTTYNKCKTVVISPLIALIQDQYNRAQQLKIPSFMMHGQLEKDENKRTLDAFLNCQYGILFLSPERWNTSVRAICEERKLELILVIDEAHCISTWGKSFRPDYKEITYRYNYFSFFKLVVLSATPTSDLLQLVKEQFKIEDISVFMGDLYRSNLAYAVKIVENQLQFVSDMLKETKDSVIIYLQSRQLVEKLSAFLNEKSIATAFFHAGLSVEEKNKQTRLFMEDQCKVMIATSAFGMGIDKPNIRYVLHLELPTKTEDYIQESGRAGRDGKKSFAYLIIEKSSVDQEKKAVKILQDLTVKIQKSLNYYQHEFSPQLPKNNFARKSILSVVSENKHLFKLDDAIQIDEKSVFVKLSSDHFLMNRTDSSVQDFLDLLIHFYSAKIFSDFVEIDLKKISDKTFISVSDLRKSMNQASESGFLQIKTDSPKTKIEFPLTWKTPSTEGSKTLILGLSEKIKQLQYWIDYVEEKQCLSNHLVSALTQSKSDYECGICSYCIAGKTTEITEMDLEKMYNVMRRNMHKISYSQLIRELSVNWNHETQYPVSILNKMIQFALREKKIAEIRTREATIFELKML